VAPLPEPERKVDWYEDAEILLACGCDVVFAIVWQSRRVA